MLNNLLPHHKIFQKNRQGFTIIEVIVVIVIVGILVTLVIVSLRNQQQSAKNARNVADLSILKRAIIIARDKENKSLYAINGLPSSQTTLSNCLLSGVEPKDRPKTDQCWTVYYASLDKIEAASGVDLETFKRGDKRGNPYTILEMEERISGSPCPADQLGYFTGSGTNTMGVISIPPYTLACQ